MSGFINQSSVENVRTASDIVDVVGSYVPLQRAGASFKARCPFHDDKTPSFHVNPRLQTYHCFGCGKGGDVFKFLQEYEGVSFPEAVERLAKRSGVVLEYEGGSEGMQERSLRQRLFDLHEQVAALWHETYRREPESEPARAYLHGRGVSEDSIRAFQIGFAPDSWDHLLHWGRAKGFSIQEMTEAGLAIERSQGDGAYSRFRGRLMFPIRDMQGRVVGFSGRVLPGADESGGKYINSPETLLFKKSRLLYGLDKARRACLKEGRAILCEGQLDTIAFHAAGIENAVAPQGTAVVETHVTALKRFIKEVVFCFDSDSAGMKAVTRAAQLFLNQDISVTVARIPAPHDPDSYLKEFGAEALRDRLDRPAPYFDFLLDFLVGVHDSRTERGRLEILAEVEAYLRPLRNELIISHAIQKLAFRLQSNEDAIRAELRRQRAQPRFGPQERAINPPEADAEEASSDNAPLEPLPPAPANEVWLLRLLFEGSDPIALCLRFLDPEWITHEGVQQLANARLEDAAAGVELDAATFLSETSDPRLHAFLSSALAEETPTGAAVETTRHTLMKLRDRFIEREVRRLATEAAQTENNESLLLEAQALRMLKGKDLDSNPDPEASTG